MSLFAGGPRAGQELSTARLCQTVESQAALQMELMLRNNRTLSERRVGECHHTGSTASQLSQGQALLPPHSGKNEACVAGLALRYSLSDCRSLGKVGPGRTLTKFSRVTRSTSKINFAFFGKVHMCWIQTSHAESHPLPPASLVIGSEV